MNLLEHYIVKIYSEETQVHDGITFVEVDMDIDCWGRKERVKKLFGFTEWEYAKKKGYYMA